MDWNGSSGSIPNGLAGTVEFLQHPLHFAMQLAVFAILCKRGPKEIRRAILDFHLQHTILSVQKFKVV